MAKVEARKVETADPEGATGDHTSYEYQFGAEIDGVFVPFVTKSGGYIDHLVAAGKDAADKAKKDGGSSSTTDTEDGGES
jgi:hypothetical protein